MKSWHGGCDRARTPMNTTLKLISLVLAASLLSSFSAQLAGVSVPTAINPLHIFGALVAALVLLTFVADYARTTSLAALIARRTALAGASVKAANPLAA